MNFPGVVGVIRFGQSLAPVDPTEIEALRRVQETGFDVEACEYLPIGQKIWIADGPLQGLEGVVAEDEGQQDMVLSITLLQRSVRVKLSRELITVREPVMTRQLLNQLSIPVLS